MVGKDCGESFIALQEELQQLPGVVNTELARDTQGELLFVHLLIHQLDERQKQQLLERVIACGRKRRIDIGEGQVTLALRGTQAVGQNDEARAVIDGVLVRSEKDVVAVEVRLDQHGRKYSGKQSGLDRSPLRMRVGGEATLAALQQILPPECNLLLLGIRKVIIEEYEAVVALVGVLYFGREVRFTGAALNEHGDEIQAAVKAVLAALNRFLTSSLI